MKRILILFAHPAFHKSKINKSLIDGINSIEGVTFNNLYEKYPDFFIDIKNEQKLLHRHDIIIWHHPFYWHSCPSLLKEWIDHVLEYNFAYGPKGHALEGKSAISVISTGGSKHVYSPGGPNLYTINQFLAPFHQTANFCRLNYLPPFVIHGSHSVSEAGIIKYKGKYIKLIKGLKKGHFLQNAFNSNTYINDLI